MRIYILIHGKAIDVRASRAFEQRCFRVVVMPDCCVHRNGKEIWFRYSIGAKVCGKRTGTFNSSAGRQWRRHSSPLFFFLQNTPCMPAAGAPGALAELVLRPAVYAGGAAVCLCRLWRGAAGPGRRWPVPAHSLAAGGGGDLEVSPGAVLYRRRTLPRVAVPGPRPACRPTDVPPPGEGRRWVGLASAGVQRCDASGRPASTTALAPPPSHHTANAVSRWATAKRSHPVPCVCCRLY